MYQNVCHPSLNFMLEMIILLFVYFPLFNNRVCYKNNCITVRSRNCSNFHNLCFNSAIKVDIIIFRFMNKNNLVCNYLNRWYLKCITFKCIAIKAIDILKWIGNNLLCKIVTIWRGSLLIFLRDILIYHKYKGRYFVLVTILSQQLNLKQ